MAQAAVEYDPVSEMPLARRNGLDPDAVRALVRRLTGERDAALAQGRQVQVELQRTKDSLLQLRAELDGAEAAQRSSREREAAVADALVTANTLARSVTRKAEEDAERALADARVEAQTILGDARAQSDEILREAAASVAAMSESGREQLATMRAASQAVGERVRRAASDLRAQADVLDGSAVSLPADLDNGLLVGVGGSRLAVDPEGPLLVFGSQGEGRATGLLGSATAAPEGVEESSVGVEEAES